VPNHPSHPVLFKNARLVFPDRIEPVGDLRMEGGKITSVAAKITPETGENVLDLQGNYLAPGFIDIHLHGAMGRDTMEAAPDAFRKISAYHASEGTTSMLLTTVSAPLTEIVGVLKAVQAFQVDQQFHNHSGAEVLGVHVEGPYFSPEKAGAHQSGFIHAPFPEDYAPLLPFSKGANPVFRQMTLAPELPGALELIDVLRGHGVRISGGHSNAWDEEACMAYVHGMEGVTHLYNCMSSARRRGPFRVAGLLEFALSEPGIVCELIADGKHVSPTLVRMAYFAKGADGLCLVSDACPGAGLPEGTAFKLGTIDCVVQGGVGMTADGTALAGSTSSMIQLIRNLVVNTDISLTEAVRMATYTPAKALKLDNKGVLRKGADADLVSFNDDLEVQATFVGGSQVFAR
jgi:N-acetylglucosamine-6-phosphate deacetylase